MKEALLPAEIVTGKESPLRLNTELLIPAAVIVTSAPLAVRVPVLLPLFPTITLPKPRVVGFTVSCPTAMAAPVPESGIVTGVLSPLYAIEILPLAVPDVDGEKETLRFALCPAVSVMGAVIPLMVNSAPVIWINEIVSVDPPLFVTVSVVDCFLPTVTLPKLKFELESAIAPGWV